MELDYEMIGGAKFGLPKMIRNDWYAWQAYKELSDDFNAVYVLRGLGGEILYVGSSTQLRTRLTSHMYSSTFKDEIRIIEYIICEHMNMYELERILYFLLKPKYSQKKITPQTYYRMYRRRN